MVRLKDTELQQPSSLCASDKASLCLKHWILSKRWVQRLGLSQGRLQKDVVRHRNRALDFLHAPVGSFVQGLWDILLHASFSMPRNWGIIRVFLLNSSILNIYIFFTRKAYFCSTTFLWPKPFSVSDLYCFQAPGEPGRTGRGKCEPWKKGHEWVQEESEGVPQNRFLWVLEEQRLQRGQFTIVLQWVMNLRSFQPEHVIHVSSQRRKRPFTTTAWLDCFNSFSDWATLTCSTITSCMEPIRAEIALILYVTLFVTSVVIFKAKLCLSLQLSTFPAWFWAISTSSNVNDITLVGSCHSNPLGSSGTANLNHIQVCGRQSHPFTSNSQRKIAYFVM